MSQNYLNGSRKAPAQSAINKLSSDLGCPIDEEFLKFLQENNGGAPRRRWFVEEGRKIYLQAFFPLAEGIDPNIRERTRLLDLPRFCAHIGLAGMGSFLLLDADSGEILVMESGRVEILASDIWRFVSIWEGEEEPVWDRITALGASGDVDALKVYLREGHDINGISNGGRTLMQIAATSRNMEMVKACVEAGGSISGIAEALRRVAAYPFLKRLQNEGILPPEAT